MLKKISTTLFLVIYLSVSAVSFADEVVLEIVSETPAPVAETIPEPISEPVPEIVTPIVENISEEIISDTPAVEEIVLPVASGDIPEPVVENIPISQEVLPSQEVQAENVTEPTFVEDIIDLLNAAPEETTEEIIEDIPTTEEPPTTTLVEVEENSIFTPPGPEPEPWQPAVREDPTTDNIPVGDTETQSDPVFLAENSVFTRRMIENIVIDPTAKHSCKVDVFRTDISETAASTLLVKFYGTSMLAAYDAEIGSLPNGIDVRFAKNNDYIYDFRGKETTLELTVNNQDGSLAGDFTIPIIYTYKGKKESTVICQLNIVNEEEEVSLVPVILPIVQPVEPVLDPAQELVEEILDAITPEPEVIPVADIQSPITVEEILEILVPEDIPPGTLPIIEIPPITVPEIEEELPIIPPAESTPPEPADDTVAPSVVQPEDITTVPEPVVESVIIPEAVPEVVAPVVENPPTPEPTPISPPDVSST